MGVIIEQTSSKQSQIWLIFLFLCIYLWGRREDVCSRQSCICLCRLLVEHRSWEWRIRLDLCCVTDVPFTAHSIKGSLSITSQSLLSCSGWLIPTHLQNHQHFTNGHTIHPTIFKSLGYGRCGKGAAERPTHSFLPATSSSSSWGEPKNQCVLDLLWDLLLVSRVGRQPKGSLAWCPRHLSWLLSMRSSSGQFDGPPKTSSSQFCYEYLDKPTCRNLILLLGVISFLQSLPEACNHKRGLENKRCSWVTSRRWMDRCSCVS